MKPKHFQKDLPENIYEGIITEVGISRHVKGYREVSIRGFSPTIFIDGINNYRSFTDKPLTEIVDSIFENIPHSKLSIKKDTQYTDPIPYFVQYNESNFHFLHRLAALYGEWCFYNGTELIFGKISKDHKVNLPVDKDLFDFDFSLKILPISHSQVAYNYIENEVYNSTSSDISVNDLDQYGKFLLGKSEDIFKQEPVYFNGEINEKDTELNKWLERKKYAQSKNLVVASGISDNPFINVGSVINITEERKNEDDFGEFIITSVSHSTDGTGNYQNSFEAIPFNANTPPSNPNIEIPFGEIQSAIIKENDDPDLLGRVKVQFHWQEKSETTPWIRVVQPHGGNGQGELHGFYFIPEIDDEVLIGFENDNPNCPIILGSLYHGKSNHDTWADSDNKRKIIKTRNGNQIIFNDEDGKEEIRILNKDVDDATNEISLSMDGSGKITIQTKGDLEIKAQSITMDSEQDIKISSGQSTKIETQELKFDATNTSLKSSAEFKLDSTTASIKSSAQLEINGTGQTVIKGGIVTIN
jgi:uncharacterized protein involved in type VI secretion and phage assembly